MKRNNFSIVLAILIAVMLISIPAYLIVPMPKNEPQVSGFPMQIGQWVGKDMPVEENAYEILETHNFIMREYSRGQDKVFIYIIYSTDNRKVSHPPEVCFEGSGVTITQKEKVPLELAQNKRIAVNRLLLEKAGVMNVVVYWYKAGKHYFDNYLNQQLHVALSRLRFKTTGSALIRLSAEVSPDQKNRAFENIKEFAKEISVYFDSVIP